jgi:hypothetical protein
MKPTGIHKPSERRGTAFIALSPAWQAVLFQIADDYGYDDLGDVIDLMLRYAVVECGYAPPSYEPKAGE